MIDGLGESIIVSLKERVAKLVASLFRATLEDRPFNGAAGEAFVDRFTGAGFGQFTQVYSWAKRTYAYDFLEPLDTAKHTISIDMSYNLRRQDNRHVGGLLLRVKDVLLSGDNMIILGDPGSGKTTMIKRMLLDNFFSNNLAESRFFCPLLVICRNITEDKPFYAHVADSMGLKYEKRREGLKGKNETTGEIEIRYVTDFFIGNILLSDFVEKALWEFEFLIVMEGFDEIAASNANAILKEMEEWGRKMTKVKMMLTCRNSFLSRKLEGFSYVHICDLTPNQIRGITLMYLDNAESFLSELRKKSYFDLAQKPLFLTYLILLYKFNGAQTQSLPETSREVYDEIIDFFLVRWDKDRGIFRTSKYSLSKPAKKKEFLAYLSFSLTYKIKSKIFSKRDLVEAYNMISMAFNLPEDEAEEVAEELETHTGLLIKSYGGNYEFSHLSIQEYLCACYLVKDPFSDQIQVYFREYAPPLALTIALASNPAGWFVNIISKSLYHLDGDAAYYTESSKILLNRLTLERPYFAVSKEAGYAILYLCDLCDCTNADFYSTLNDFVTVFPNMRKSLAEAMPDFSLFSRAPLTSKVRFKRVPVPDTGSISIIHQMDFGALPLSTYKMIQNL
jgi:hypothetical protein